MCECVCHLLVYVRAFISCENYLDRETVVVREREREREILIPWEFPLGN